MSERSIPNMSPGPGSRLRRFVGDHLRLELTVETGIPTGWTARVRTNLGRGALLREEIIRACASGIPPAGASWRDVPMTPIPGRGWGVELPLSEPGFFQAKAYMLDERGWQHWPEGPDLAVSVHPNHARTANTIYCAFTRLFGPTKSLALSRNEQEENILAGLEDRGFATLPPSGKLRDLAASLPHIIDTLGCRILHLLPVHPTPTAYARFGRFGSPYAALDLTAIDPALVDFDKRSTGIEQFQELAYETHRRGARLFLDIVINHTGWGSVLQENHPEWFIRAPDGTFASPGAWGITWEDLIELKHANVELWDKLAEVFLVWCRRGVDGFRCDAGYKVPVRAWQYIVSRVQQEYPETIFLLEGLGGPWEATEALLGPGGMQWAYSELFQNYSSAEISDYLDHVRRHAPRVGTLAHYSETHDNDRLAARGKQWSLLRNRLCALASDCGAFGFTCGVEWLATEKIKVHGSAGLSWGAAENILPELSRLNHLLCEHPCFFDGAETIPLSEPGSPVCAMLRVSEEKLDTVLVLINTDLKKNQAIAIDCEKAREHGLAADGPEISKLKDLLDQEVPPPTTQSQKEVSFTLRPGMAWCLARDIQPRGLSGEAYRRARAQAAWGLAALAHCMPLAFVPRIPWQRLAQLVQDPVRFLSAASYLSGELAESHPLSDHATGPASIGQFEKKLSEAHYPPVAEWTMASLNRVMLVPEDHWLLVRDQSAFRARLSFENGDPPENLESIELAGGSHVAAFRPRALIARAKLSVERYGAGQSRGEGALQFVTAEPAIKKSNYQPTDLLLLTNGRGGMARMRLDLGNIQSKYDCVLGANLHPTLPVDRHILAKRLRAWVNADGFISPLDFRNLQSFTPGKQGCWEFVANAGDGRTVQISLSAEMSPGQNTVVFNFARPSATEAVGRQLPVVADVCLTLRLDIEDRGFHGETHRNGGAEYHFATNTKPMMPSSVGPHRAGFSFVPAADRSLHVFADAGKFHEGHEWSENIPHPMEQSRGQVGAGDAFSPGWFEIPLDKGARVRLVVTAEQMDQALEVGPAVAPPADGLADSFETALANAAKAFVVRRGKGKTVIAGYPWFLDWGRDTFIAARGLLAAGMAEEVADLVVTFARFEDRGTLPNTILGEDASNRDTSDAPLWFAIVCEDLAGSWKQDGARGSKSFYDLPVNEAGCPVIEVLKSIAAFYRDGTPNGIRMDAESGLIWSPSHFTWMDTNHPACTPRQGYPIEIQALWVRLLRQLTKVSPMDERKGWEELSRLAEGSLLKLFWMEKKGWFADVLLAERGQAAREARPDDAFRSNCLFPISLGIVEGEKARRCVQSALDHLVVPGALRSLAPLPVDLPLLNVSGDGCLLNDPHYPYWGHYEGDEDTRRKPAYHNGTAWTWTFPVFCEALARAWEFSPRAVEAARNYLASSALLLGEGCLGQVPEILDGDAPHLQRGCDAQAWGATEALRVWRLLAPSQKT